MLAIPVIVAGEFAFGIAQSRHRDAYERALQRMLDRCRVLEIGIENARHYAVIRLELKGAGTPIPANDVWIAALSRQHAMPVMSRDVHFDFVGGLRRRAWKFFQRLGRSAVVGIAHHAGRGFERP